MFTLPAVSWMLPELPPCGMVREALGKAEVSDDVSPTGIPPAGAGDVSVTVTVAAVPLGTGFGAIDTWLMAEGPVLIPMRAITVRVTVATEYVLPVRWICVLASGVQFGGSTVFTVRVALAVGLLPSMDTEAAEIDAM
jgi:hypothetical protein